MILFFSCLLFVVCFCLLFVFVFFLFLFVVCCLFFVFCLFFFRFDFVFLSWFHFQTDKINLSKKKRFATFFLWQKFTLIVIQCSKGTITKHNLLFTKTDILNQINTNQTPKEHWFGFWSAKIEREKERRKILESFLKTRYNNSNTIQEFWPQRSNFGNRWINKQL